MKKHKSLFPVLLVMLFIVSGFQYEVKGQVEDRQIEGNWNGTISFQEKYEGGWEFTGSRNETLINVTITDNKGWGTMKMDGESIIGGKSFGRLSCSGAGVVVLYDVVINPSEGTYRIVITGPDCFNGTDLHGTGSVTIDYEFQGQTPNVLSGTKTTVFQIPTEDKGTVTTTIRWNLVRSYNVELIVTPEGYDNWLPEPGRDELTKGTVIKINLKVYGKNGQPPASKVKSFELILSNTSEEPGITINAPLVPLTDLPDLRFLPQANADIDEDFQFAEVECNDGTSGDISIGAFDGGAYSTLSVVAILEDDSRIEGHLLISGGNTEIPIPKRPAGSKIGVAWLVANNNPGDMDDNETSTGNANNGDGLTAYEEYRGVISEGQFRRLDPNKKELGVKIKKAELPFFAEGISKFENVTGLKVIRFYETEIAANRMLNKNTSSAHDYDQYVLSLFKSTLPANQNGNAFGGPGIPLQVDRVIIDATNISQAYRMDQAEANRMNTTLPYSEKDLLTTVIAHELAHGVNISHHGSVAPISLNQTFTTGNPVRIFRFDGSEILNRPYLLNGRVGIRANEQSGDLTCILAINSLCDWAFRDGVDTSFFYEVPILPLGTRLCNTQLGTSINAGPNYFGNAAKGNCVSQMKLRN